jgi:hypothetical protein
MKTPIRPNDQKHQEGRNWEQLDQLQQEQEDRAFRKDLWVTLGIILIWATAVFLTGMLTARYFF